MNIFDELIKNNILFDSHCHLNDESYDIDRDQIVENSLGAGVSKIFDIGINLESSKRAIENARNNPHVVASVGIDMETCVPGSDIYIQSKDEIFAQFDELESLILEQKNYIGMVGETGLDLYWLNRSTILGPKEILDSLETQKTLFKNHIELAQKFNLPLSIHSRDTIEICLQMLEDCNYSNAILHSLTPNTGMDEDEFSQIVNQILEMNVKIGVNGIITFKNAHTIRNAYTKILKEKTNKDSNWLVEDWYKTGFVFETDGPYLSPEGKRGERNEPANIKLIFDYFTQTQSSYPIGI